MNIEFTREALVCVTDLLTEDALEANILLMEDSIDMILSGEIPEDKELCMDLVSSYRRLSKQFKTILEQVKEQSNEKE